MRTEAARESHNRDQVSSRRAGAFFRTRPDESERHETTNFVKLLTSDGRVRKARGSVEHGAPSTVALGIRRRRGFTLIELLVVITIIGIILGFVLVAGMEAASRARSAPPRP